MIFFDRLEDFASAPAITDDSGIRMSYYELVQKSDFISSQIKKRTLVFCLADNSWESVAGYLGFIRKRIVPLLLSNTLNLESLNGLVDVYRPEYIWLPLNKVEGLGIGSEISRLGTYALIKTNYQQDYSLHRDLALLLTTSGSTGSPMLVRQSYQNISSNADSICAYLGITGQDRPITTLPMNYTYGLSIINSHLCAGAEIILTNRSLMDKGFWELLRKHRVTTFGGVPYTYEILKRLRFAKMELPDLRVITQAGGRLNPTLAEEFAGLCHQKEIRFFIMYGQTEATARMSYLPSHLALSRFSSIGIAIPGGEFWLENETGDRILESESPGELIYRGENVSMGYARHRFDLERPDENHGVLRTGDIAKRDGDGLYYIVGRKKRFLKLFGNRINLDEIEQKLNELGMDCACTGKDDLMKIYVTTLTEASLVKRTVAEFTKIHHSAFEVVPIDEIPRNEFGKIQYTHPSIL